VKNIAQLLQINGSNESKERKENFVLHFGGIVQKKLGKYMIYLPRKEMWIFLAVAEHHRSTKK
jgi:hypothetical protein